MFGVFAMEDDWMKTLGRTIYTLRKIHRLSLTKAAALLHVSPRTLKQIESGYIGPRVSWIVLVYASQTFHIKISDLFKES